MRRNPLDRLREPGMGRLALVPIAAAALFVAVAVVGQQATEQRRIRAVESAVLTNGRAGPVEVEPIRGEECGRAREGFRWRTRTEQGWACAGPGGEVTLKDAAAVEAERAPATPSPGSRPEPQ